MVSAAGAVTAANIRSSSVRILPPPFVTWLKRGGDFQAQSCFLFGYQRKASLFTPTVLPAAVLFLRRSDLSREEVTRVTDFSWSLS